MDFIVEILAELIITPVVELYTSAMMRIFGRKIRKDKIKVIVVFECLIMLILFIIGGIMLLDTNGESISGKILLCITSGISLIQILVGCIIKKTNKDRNTRGA